jgi:hypothetical protein
MRPLPSGWTAAPRPMMRQTRKLQSTAGRRRRRDRLAPRPEPLAKAVRDVRWQDWLRSLPTPQHPSPTALETYLIALQQALENCLDLLDGLGPATRQDLQNALSLHTDMIQCELDREARAVESRILAELLAKAGGVLGAFSPEAKAGGATLGALAAIPHRRQAARLAQLREQAQTPRRLLLNLREMLVRLP